MKLNSLAEAFTNLLMSIAADSIYGLMRDHDELEQELFELFVSKGYNTAEARKLAMHVVEALEE